MQCRKCGATIADTDKVCMHCGEPVTQASSQNFYANNQQQMNNINRGNPVNGNMNNPNIQNNYQPLPQNTNQVEKKKGSHKILKLLLGLIIFAIVGGAIIFFIVYSASNKLVCKSNQGNITIMYNKDGLTGYTISGMSYDFEEQKKYAKQIGVDAYTKEFSEWFSTNTTGSCTINGKKVEQSSANNKNKDNTNSNTTTNNDTKVVGDDNYGYISIPSNWNKFYDVDGNNSLQYSYANVYIVSLNVLEGTSSAKDYASNYMYNKQNSSDVTGVTGATVKIGKNKEYTAYQVYMYYPSDSTYLVTYWFEAEDGKIHYIALEGPQELNGVKITDYLYIPESFSLKK